ncbi:MAG TPA: hypothetical protein VHF89_00160, partial [Solirubrobacteraceae bacterium]|nr:hypothetical protein [Solirubrobacteraceae bacterium]
MRPRGALPIALLATALAACGGDDEPSAQRPAPAPASQAPATVPVVASEPAPAVDVARERRLAARLGVAGGWLRARTLSGL